MTAAARKICITIFYFQSVWREASEVELLDHREGFISTAVKDCKANKTPVWFGFILKTSSPYAAQAVRLAGSCR